MAVAFDAVGPSSSGFVANTGTPTSASWSHTLSASATALLIWVAVDNISSLGTITATAGGVSLTQLPGSPVLNASSGAGICLAFGLLSPPTGTITISVSFTTGGADCITAGSMSFIGAGSFGTPATLVSSFGTTIAITVTGTSASSLVAAFCGLGDSPVSPSAPATSQFQALGEGGGGSSNGNSEGATSSGGGSVTTTWGGLSAGNTHCALAVEVLASAGPVITTTSLPTAPEGMAYSFTLQAAGGTTPYTWSISSGSLPGWASLNSSTGSITGTPAFTDIGSTSFTAEVTDNSSLSNTQPLTLTVAAEMNIESAWPGYPAPGTIVPGQLIFYNTTQHYTQTLAAQVTASSSLGRRIARGLAAIATVRGSITRQLARLLATTLIVLGAVSKRVGRILAGNTVTTGNLTALRLKIVLLVTTLVATASVQQKIGRTLAAVATVTGTLGRGISRTIAGIVTISASAAKNLPKTFIAIVTVTPGAVASRLKLVTLSALVNLTAPVLSRGVSRVLSGQVVVYNPLTRGISKLVASTVAVRSGESLRVSRVLQVIVTVTGLANRGVVKPLGAQIVANAQIVRTVAKGLAARVAVGSLTTRVIGKPLTVVTVNTGTIRRSISRNLIAGTVILGKVSRSIAKSISAFVTLPGFLKAGGQLITSALLRIILPGGRYKLIDSALNIALPKPGVILTAHVGTVSTFNITLPLPKLSVTALVPSGLKVRLPKPQMSITGKISRGLVNIKLPEISLSLSGVIDHTGTFNIEFGETPLMLVRKFLGLKSPNDYGEPPDFTITAPRVNWKVGMPGTEWTVSYNSSIINHLSTEYLLVPVQATKAGVPYNPTADTVKFAFAPYPNYSPQVSDWVAGAWDTDSSSVIYPYSAKCLVGPNGAKTLAQGTYTVYIQITDSPEIPVLVAGQLTIS